MSRTPEIRSSQPSFLKAGLLGGIYGFGIALLTGIVFTAIAEGVFGIHIYPYYSIARRRFPDLLPPDLTLLVLFSGFWIGLAIGLFCDVLRRRSEISRQKISGEGKGQQGSTEGSAGDSAI